MVNVIVHYQTINTANHTGMVHSGNLYELTGKIGGKLPVIGYLAPVVTPFVTHPHWSQAIDQGTATLIRYTCHCQRLERLSNCVWPMVCSGSAWSCSAAGADHRWVVHSTRTQTSQNSDGVLGRKDPFGSHSVGFRVGEAL